MLARQIGGAGRSGVLVGLEYEAAHAAGFGERHGVENVERPDHSAWAGRVRIEVHMDIDGAHQRRVGEAKVHRPAHRVDLPIIELAGVLSAACTISTQNDA